MTTDAGMDVSPSWQELKDERDRLARVNREQQGLLDEIWRYVDESGLARLGQSRVTRLIEAHREASAHNARLVQAGNALRDELEFWQGSELAVRTQEARDRWTFAVEAATCDT